MKMRLKTGNRDIETHKNMGNGATLQKWKRLILKRQGDATKILLQPRKPPVHPDDYKSLANEKRNTKNGATGTKTTQTAANLGDGKKAQMMAHPPIKTDYMKAPNEIRIKETKNRTLTPTRKTQNGARTKQTAQHCREADLRKSLAPRCKAATTDTEGEGEDDTRQKKRDK